MKRLARNRAPLPQLRTLTLAVSAALASLSAQAGVDIAQQPLLIAPPVAPNIVLLLDNTGSMQGTAMCASNYKDGASDMCTGTPNGFTYTRNTLAYNPAITYKPWVQADGSSMSNADPKAAFGDADFLVSPTNLWSKPKANNDPTPVPVFNNFYVPQSAMVAGGAGDTDAATTTNNGNTAALTRWVLGSDTTTTIAKAWRCSPVTNANKTNDPPQTGANASNCVAVTSLTWILSDGGTITRTIAEEWQNYANWYQYYRTRSKMAKGSVSIAFAGLDEGFRVGYWTLQPTNVSGTNNGAAGFNIPVSNDQGLFRGANKQTFYDKLFTTYSLNGTTTRQRLNDLGTYFKQTGSDGPWGPESGDAQISCRQNFAIVASDGGWNESPAPAVGDVDSTAGPTHTNLKGTVTYTYDPVAPYRDRPSGVAAPPGTVVPTLADVAMYYWKNDLRTDMPNNVKTTPTNPAFWQHMRTFTISIGRYGNVNPADVKLPPAGAYPTNWGTPTTAGDDTPEKIDDLLHAAINGRGQFIVASDPEKFSKGLSDALSTITSQTKYEASGGASSAQVEAGARTFFSNYSNASWNGDLVAFAVDPATGLQDQSATVWDAEAQLPAWTSRNIQVNVNGLAKPFVYGNLSGAQKAFLTADIVDFLRGDRSKEADKPGGTLRQRAGVLPAFINSQLVYVAAPTNDSLGTLSFTGAGDYAAYATAQQGRKPAIYIAGNDGMLHAFEADTGKEIYAFLPNFSISQKLANYADKSYGSNTVTAKPFEYILDGELTVADAYLDGAWKTILVATQGRAGSGIFALDVTDPDNVQFLWEKTATDDNALGNNLGKPVIAQVKDQDWRVMLGNGPNGAGDKAQLLMFDLATGDLTTVDTGAGVDNGLAAVNPVDTNNDGFYDTAYAGDLQGNVWRFKDLGASPSSGKLFAGGATRPITAMPLVARNLKTGDLWVFVGTGRYLNHGDLSDTHTQTWYGLIDSGSTIASSNQLVKRSIIGVDTGGRLLESGTEYDITGSGKRGWYIDFDLPADKGERMMVPNSIRGGVLMGFTFTPDVSDTCDPTGFSSLWAINPFSGGRTDQGLFDTNGDGVPDKITVAGGDYFLTVMDGMPPVTSGAPPSMFKPSGGGGGKKPSGLVPPPPDKPPQICYDLPPPLGTMCYNAPMGQVGRQSWRETVR